MRRFDRMHDSKPDDRSETNVKRNVKKVVLAYSGGLDTSIIMPWIKENYGGAEIIALLRRRGPGRRPRGGAQEGARHRRQRSAWSRTCARSSSATTAFKALSAGAVYEDNYLLGTALARPLLAYRQVQAALREGADALAHGATGKGNDQVRFEVTYAAFAPHLRGDRALARVEHPLARGRARLRRASTTCPSTRRRRDLFSRDGNLWHLSHEGGNLEDTWNAPLKEMFKLTVDPHDAPDHAPARHDRLRAGRAGGARRQAARAGGARRDAQPDRGRPRRGPARPRGEPPRRHQVARRLRDARGHRAPHRPPRARAPRARPRHPALQAVGLRALRPAHLRRALVLDAARGARRASWTRPRRRSRARCACASTRARAEAVGRRSPRSLYRQDLATFGEGMAYDHKDAEGFIRLFGLPERVRALTRDRMPVDVKAVEVTAGARPGGEAPARSVSVTAPLGLPGRGRRRRASSPTGSTWRSSWPTRPCAAAGGLHHEPRAGRARRWSRASTSRAGRARAIVVNAGCANAATGDAGLADAREMAALAATRRGLPARGGGGGLHRRHRRAAAHGQGARGHRRGRAAPLARRAAPTRRARS